MKVRFLVLLLLMVVLMGSKPVREQETSEKIPSVNKIAQMVMVLHQAQGPSKVNVVWHECGKSLKGEVAEKRALEYATAIRASIEDVYTRTGKLVNAQHVNAILFRESSHDECIIGKRETKRLREELGREPTKHEFWQNLRRWRKARLASKKWCNDKPTDDFCQEWCKENTKKKSCRSWCKKVKGPSVCVNKHFNAAHPEYHGITGWDLGAAQYRWPGNQLHRRSMVLPSGKVYERIQVEDLLNYEVAIQMLVEDMTTYRSSCEKHTHWEMSKWNHRVRKIPVDEAYFVHHHTGTRNWSQKYWRAVRRHLRITEKSNDAKVAWYAPKSLFMSIRGLFFS